MYGRVKMPNALKNDFLSLRICLLTLWHIPLKILSAVKHLKFPPHLSWIPVEKDLSQGRLHKIFFRKVRAHTLTHGQKEIKNL